jgi:hypothetical protein
MIKVSSTRDSAPIKPTNNKVAGWFEETDQEQPLVSIEKTKKTAVDTFKCSEVFTFPGQDKRSVLFANDAYDNLISNELASGWGKDSKAKCEETISDLEQNRFKVKKGVIQMKIEKLTGKKDDILPVEGRRSHDGQTVNILTPGATTRTRIPVED